MNMNIKYHDKNLTPICFAEKGNWIDLRASKVKYQIGTSWREHDLIDKPFEYPANSFMLIDLGISIDLTLYAVYGSSKDNYPHEALVVPRGSTFKNYGLIQTNSIGVIDTSYCGDNDKWFFPCLSMRKGKISHNDRICQFRLIKPMDYVDFVSVNSLGNEDRGGHGSTGVK
jgi:dUTP pyrophosphatase